LKQTKTEPVKRFIFDDSSMNLLGKIPVTSLNRELSRDLVGQTRRKYRETP